jgi:hypothetical protein
MDGLELCVARNLTNLILFCVDEEEDEANFGEKKNSALFIRLAPFWFDVVQVGCCCCCCYYYYLRVSNSTTSAFLMIRLDDPYTPRLPPIPPRAVCARGS